MKKRDSKRRWKARCLIGRAIPRTAIDEHGLSKWFDFRADGPLEYYRALPRA